MKIKLLIVALIGLVPAANGQRQYASGSVLSEGQWLKIAVGHESVYKITGEMLQKAGFPAGSKSDNIRLYGNGGAVLPEGNDKPIPDDLLENSIFMEDGGDGKFDAVDYFLFYAEGPDVWRFDSVTNSYKYLHHPYSEKSYYFITFSSSVGKRLKSQTPSNGGISVAEYDELYHHELDSINLLKSGREWYGEEFNQQLGLTSRTFGLPFSNVVIGKNIRINSEIIGRSNGQVNRIGIQLNGSQVLEHTTTTLMGTLIEPAANVSNLSAMVKATGDKIEVKYVFSPGSITAKAWLNWFELKFRRGLTMEGMAFLKFRDQETVGVGKTALFNLKNISTDTRVWDVTDPITPLIIKPNFSGTQLNFSSSSEKLHEFIAFESSKSEIPEIIGSVPNQNLHGAGPAQMVIITENSMLAEAERLASFHRIHDGLSVQVTGISQVFNEFSSGSTDPSAVRNFLKMFYDRYSKDTSNKIQYLLFLGSASYVYKGSDGLKYNRIPSYQSESSLDPLTSYVTDDFFGFLDDNDDISKVNSIPLMDISIGRIPARNVDQARIAVNKILSYHTSAAFGAWRNDITFVADDEDYNVHLNDAEEHAKLVKELAPNININKIYLDAFNQESGSGGSRYPDVNKAINKAIGNGTLIWNYSGHGGSNRLAQEAILDKVIASAWNNSKKLPLFITATCDFAPFDDHTQFSIGEELIIGSNTGAIGLLTTTRLVFASSNKITNNNFLKYLLQKNAQGKYPTIGRALSDSKNYTVSSSGDFINSRKFILLGDPAMKIAIPEMKITTTLINGRSTGLDTLKANGRYVFSGEVQTIQGALANSFNGTVYPTLYAQPTITKTLVNDPQSRAATFEEQRKIIYEGKVNVVNGKFNFTCIIPSDLDPTYSFGKLSYYAENTIVDASGADMGMILGGKSILPLLDQVGPEIKCYLNDTTFRNGIAVKPISTLLLSLFDSSGINISGLGIGHDLSATLDGDFRKTWYLNDFYEPGLNGGVGELTFDIPEMEEGPHQMVVRAWDNFNNSSTCTMDFKVVPVMETAIEQIKLYPNPTWTGTSVSFSLLGLAGAIDIELQVFTSTGRAIKTIRKAINTPVGRSIEVGWNGLDEMGKKPQKGIYLIRVNVKNSAGRNVQKVQKLILM